MQKKLPKPDPRLYSYEVKGMGMIEGLCYLFGIILIVVLLSGCIEKAGTTNIYLKSVSECVLLESDMEDARMGMCLWNFYEHNETHGLCQIKCYR